MLINQSSVLENGPYIVGRIDAGFANLTRPSWWSTSSIQYTNNIQFRIGSEGNVYGGSVWTAFGADERGSALDFIAVDTNDPVIFPLFFNSCAFLVFKWISTDPIFCRSYILKY